MHIFIFLTYHIGYLIVQVTNRQMKDMHLRNNCEKSTVLGHVETRSNYRSKQRPIGTFLIDCIGLYDFKYIAMIRCNSTERMRIERISCPNVLCPNISAPKCLPPKCLAHKCLAPKCLHPNDVNWKNVNATFQVISIKG